MRLFCASAEPRSPLGTDERTIRSIAEICRRLDGIPLALELAAPHLAFMTADELRRRLESGVGWLATRDADVPERQRTMESAVQWSYDLLTENQKRLFRLVSVFAGTWSLEAIFAPWFDGGPMSGSVDGTSDAPESRSNVVALVESLVEQNLMVRTATSQESRYRMLQSILEFASRRLSESADAARARERHATYFFERARLAVPELHGADMIDRLDGLERDYANLELGTDWYENHGNVLDGIAFGISLVWFWYLRGHFADGRRHLEKALARFEEERSSSVVGRALGALGWITFVEGNFGSAVEILHRALAIARSTGDAYGESSALSSLGITERFRGNAALAMNYFDESLGVARGVGDDLLLMYAMNWAFASSGGKSPGAPPFAELDEALRLSRKTGDLWSYARIQNGLGDLFRETGNFASAHASYEESLAQMELLNDRWMMAWNYEGLEGTAFAEGRSKAAIRDYQRALDLFAVLGDTGDTLYVVERITCVLASLGMFAELAPILAALPAMHDRDADEALAAENASAAPAAGGDYAWPIPGEPEAAAARCRREYPADWSSGRTLSLDSLAAKLKSILPLAGPEG